MAPGSLSDTCGTEISQHIGRRGLQRRDCGEAKSAFAIGSSSAVHRGQWRPGVLHVFNEQDRFLETIFPVDLENAVIV